MRRLGVIIGLVLAMASFATAEQVKQRFTDAEAAALPPLTAIREDAHASDPSFVRTRCFAFFTFVNVAWAMAAPYGSKRQAFNEFRLNPGLSGATDAEIWNGRKDHLVQRYLNTIDGIDPERNVQQPAFRSDAGTCAALVRVAR